MRLALALIAAIANAAGPWLCCCAVGAILFAPRQVSGQTLQTFEIVEQCSGCCPNHPPADEHSSDQSRPSPPVQPCPCEERAASIPTALPASPESIAVDADLAVQGMRPESLDPRDSCSVPAPLREFRQVFFPPETRQRVHHVLHC